MDLPGLTRVMRSDLLPTLRRFFSTVEAQLGDLAEHGHYDFLRVRQVHIVVDANVLLSDIAYLAAKPNQKDLRTQFQGLVENQRQSWRSRHQR